MRSDIQLVVPTLSPLYCTFAPLPIPTVTRGMYGPALHQMNRVKPKSLSLLLPSVCWNKLSQAELAQLLKRFLNVILVNFFIILFPIAQPPNKEFLSTVPNI